MSKKPTLHDILVKGIIEMFDFEVDVAARPSKYTVMRPSAHTLALHSKAYEANPDAAKYRYYIGRNGGLRWGKTVSGSISAHRTRAKLLALAAKEATA